MDRNRKTAFDALLEIETKGAYSNIAVNRSIEKNRPDDQAFVRNLVYGVLENQILLDFRLSQLMKQPLKKVNKKALILLRMGAFQIEFADSVPSYAAISESVNIAKKVCRGLDGFINGVLRAYSRKNGEFNMPEEPAEYLAVKYSYNREIVSMWLDMYGFDMTEALMRSGNAAPPLTIRVNTLKTTSQKLCKRLESEGFTAKKISSGNNEYDRMLEKIALNVSGSGLIESDMYKEGLFSVQDISSMIAISALNPQQGDTILDLCAAPGGKSLFAAELTGDSGQIISCDIHEHKLELMKKAAERLDIKSMKVMKNDALVFRPEFEEIADKVIVDAPCSGLGVVRRKPEIKLHTTLKDIENLAGIQLQILENASRYVRKNGMLIYSTCTVSKYENEHVIKMFFQKNKSFYLIKESQLFPNINNADGFYFTVLQRF
jgi:16S rRNA (cytosine967-C5)-methyltransferase